MYMRKLCLPFFILLLLFAACKTPQEKSNANPERTELLPEPDRHDRLLGEAAERLRARKCSVQDPDTTLAGIVLRDAGSAIAITGTDNQPDSLGRYYFYSRKEAELLTLTQFDGDGANAISLFQVGYSGKASLGYKELPFDQFKTEKGISLGMSKKEVIRLLGPCYETVDSTTANSEIYYRIEQPGDSRTKFLERTNMPVYYARYEFRNEKLFYFEFGFEYP